MTELEKIGILILFLVLVGALILGISMIHDELVRLNIKLEKIVKGVETRNECTNERSKQYEAHMP